jgi:hypothetical protein
MSGFVSVEHLSEVQAAIKRLTSDVQPALRTVSGQARRLLVTELATYPPERAGQTYARTQKLGRGWERATPLDQGRGFELVNPIPYVGLVQGDSQAWMHVGRWQRASDIARAHEDEIQQLYDGAIKELTT